MADAPNNLRNDLAFLADLLLRLFPGSEYLTTQDRELLQQVKEGKNS